MQELVKRHRWFVWFVAWLFGGSLGFIVDIAAKHLLGWSHGTWDDMAVNNFGIAGGVLLGSRAAAFCMREPRLK